MCGTDGHNGLNNFLDGFLFCLSSSSKGVWPVANVNSEGDEENRHTSLTRM